MNNTEIYSIKEKEVKDNNAMIAWLNSQINELAILQSAGFITGTVYVKLVARFSAKRSELVRINANINIEMLTLKVRMIGEAL